MLIDYQQLLIVTRYLINIDDIEILETIPYESANKYSAVFYKQNNEVYCTDNIKDHYLEDGKITDSGTHQE